MTYNVFSGTLKLNPTQSIIPLILPIYIQSCTLITLLVLSRCQIPICSLFRLFTLHLASAASALQLLQSGTLSLQLFNVYCSFHRHLKTHRFQQAFQSAQCLPSCTSDLASADRCVFFVATLWNKAGRYIFLLCFLLSIFLSSSPMLTCRRLDA